MERTVRQWLWRWLAAAVVVSGTALLTGMGVARSTSDEPNLVVLNDLRDAIEMADKQGVNVAEIREALDNLEKALRQQLKGPPDRKAEKLDQPPKELLALREAVEAAARKGENVDAIRKELEAVERRLIGRTLRAERPPVRPVDPPGGDRPIRPPVRPRPGGDDHAIVPPGLILPRLPGDIPGIDRELFDRAQKLRDEAFRRLLDNPNDQEALQKLEEATRLMLQAIGGLQEFPPFAPVPLPAIPDRFGERPRLGVRMERVPEALADQLGLEPGRGVLIADVLPDTPAEKAGFKAHDIVMEFAGKPVPDDPEAFARLVQQVKAGEKVTAVVLRKGKRVELKDITLPEVKREARPRPRPFAVPDLGVPRVPFDFDFPMPGLGPAAGKNRMVSVTAVNGRFTINAVDDGIRYTITGVQDDLNPIEKIVIQDGDQKIETDQVDKVPEKYRAPVKELIQQYMFLRDPREKQKD